LITSFTCRTEEETERAGEKIARLLSSSSLVTFEGDLGAGKTFLIRSIATALGAERDEVSSPTFAIIHEYPRAGAPAILHLDCYRLSENPREWEEIGIPDLLREPTIKLIEWPKDGFARYADTDVEVHIRVCEDESREITVNARRTVDEEA
jgi:tRNA threonylcarbamoyladenosine biosynthesis protein TsaE